MLHSSRGGLSDPEAEFLATLRWFADPQGDSAHAVIATDGTIAEVVDYTLVAYHARWYNYAYLGVEVVQGNAGEPITDAQYQSLAWWLIQRSRQFGFPLTAKTLPEHKDTPPGLQDHKTDIGPPFDIERLLALIFQ